MGGGGGGGGSPNTLLTTLLHASNALAMATSIQILESSMRPRWREITPAPLGCRKAASSPEEGGLPLLFLLLALPPLLMADIAAAADGLCRAWPLMRAMRPGGGDGGVRMPEDGLKSDTSLPSEDSRGAFLSPAIESVASSRDCLAAHDGLLRSYLD